MPIDPDESNTNAASTTALHSVNNEFKLDQQLLYYLKRWPYSYRNYLVISRAGRTCVLHLLHHIIEAATQAADSLNWDAPTAGLHNIRSAGHMRPARSFLAARENSVAENVAKARPRIITCPFRISSTLWRNRLLRPAASLCWSIWPFELSELCRPDLQYIFKCLFDRALYLGSVSQRHSKSLQTICFQSLSFVHARDDRCTVVLINFVHFMAATAAQTGCATYTATLAITEDHGRSCCEHIYVWETLHWD